MRLIKSNNIEPEYPKRHICDECGAELEYDKEDVHIGWMGYECVTCPACDKETAVSEGRVMPPTWKTTFFHSYAAKGALDVCNQTVGEYIAKTTEILCSDKIKPGEFYITKTGNLLIIGLKWNDNIEIYVTKDYWEDTVDMDDYGIVK